jgi:lactoylglutathione lyase
MRFCWSTISVKDMEESLDFYTNVIGLSLNERRHAGPMRELAFLGGETQVELICDESATGYKKIEGISLGFELNNPEETKALLKRRGIEIESGPFTPSPHITYFFIRDPNGVKIQLLEKH